MSVASKIILVMGDVGDLGKDGHNQMQNYDYLSEARVVSELHKSCAKHGLVVMPIAMEIIDNRQIETKNGGILFDRTIQVNYKMVDPDDPEHPEFIQCLGEGMDSGDKVTNKCMTAAFKYALRETFLISTGDDPDQQGHEPATGTTQRPVQQSMRGPAQQATAQRAMSNGGSQATEAQVTYISRLIDHKVDPFERDDFVSSTVGRAITEPGQLTKQEASKLIEVLNAMPERAAA